MSYGVNKIAEERARQTEAKGYTNEHDDKHVHGDLALAAACYAIPERKGLVAVPWPFSSGDCRGKDTRERLLIKAGALIAAEIDRLHRAEYRLAEQARTEHLHTLANRFLALPYQYRKRIAQDFHVDVGENADAVDKLIQHMNHSDVGLSSLWTAVTRTLRTVLNTQGEEGNPFLDKAVTCIKDAEKCGVGIVEGGYALLRRQHDAVVCEVLRLDALNEVSEGPRLDSWEGTATVRCVGQSYEIKVYRSSLQKIVTPSSQTLRSWASDKRMVAVMGVDGNISIATARCFNPYDFALGVEIDTDGGPHRATVHVRNVLGLVVEPEKKKVKPCS